MSFQDTWLAAGGVFPLSVADALLSMQRPWSMSTNPEGAEPARISRSAALPCSGLVRCDDALLEDETAIEAPLAGLNDAIGLFCEIVEFKTLYSAHGRGAPLRGIDLGLHLGLDRRHVAGLADDFHSHGRFVDKGVER